MGFNETPEAFTSAEPLGSGLSTDAPRILLVVGGGIAAYKACELVRLMRRSGVEVTCVVTNGGQQFVTPMALAALSENKVYTSLFDLKDESEMGHIQLSRAADLVVVCPATADLLAKMAAGIADDLATTLILATDKPVIAVPAMNVRMWQHEATQRNVRWLAEAGVEVIDPDEGAMACGEFGPGRLPEPAVIWPVLAERLGLEVEVPETASPAITSGSAYSLDDLAAEALEAEEEQGDGAEHHAQGSRLGGLLSAIIPRTTPRRPAVAYEDDFTPESLEEEMPEWTDAAPEALADEEPVFAPDPASPLLAKKGKAASAPPTDAAAINHLVKTGAGGALPELLEGDGYEPLLAPVQFDPDPEHRPLDGRHVLVTAGPTWEPIDPVRYLANRSSGRQGFAIAAMAAAAGARVTLVAGPVALPTPAGVDRMDVESAEEMATQVKRALPADIAFMVAAVADWRPKTVEKHKLKKRGSAPPGLLLTENPDILATVAGSRDRPQLLIGFAAETEKVLENARAKRKRKGADWIVANDVSTDVMGGLRNTVHIISSEELESLDEMPKEDVARELVRRAAEVFSERGDGASDD